MSEYLYRKILLLVSLFVCGLFAFVSEYEGLVMTMWTFIALIGLFGILFFYEAVMPES